MRDLRNTILCLVLSIGSVVTTASQLPAENGVVDTAIDVAIWELTVEQRLAARFDADITAARMVEYGLAHLNEEKTPKYETEEGDRSHDRRELIRGWEHPELLLPHELFRALLGAYDPKVRNKEQPLVDEQLQAWGYDREVFWAKLRSAAAEYIELEYGAHDTDSSQTGDDLCRSLYDGLIAARLIFGEAEFDRFLYEAVAPSTLYSVATNDLSYEQKLRRRAEGCRE